MAAKVSKESVNYRRAGLLARQRCGTCSMFRGPSETCTLVAGSIKRRDVCDRWESRGKD